jgi:hypothetical protein
VPSPTAAYNSHYTPGFLTGKADALADGSAALTDEMVQFVAPLLDQVESPAVRGFCVLLLEYLTDAAGVNRGDGSKTGGPNRTILYGLQRPPLNGHATVLRCEATTTLDELAPTLLPFFVTNASCSVRVSCDPANTAMLSQLAKVGGTLNVVQQTSGEFEATTGPDGEELYNVVPASALADNNNTSSLEQFPMVGQFVSLYFPMGHVKSTQLNDEAFVDFFSTSNKWLRMNSSVTA